MSTNAPQTAAETVRTSSPRSYDEPRPLRHTFTETKAGFKTTEFYVMVLFVAGVLLATYADEDTLSRDRGWLIAGIAVAAYIISRGLAKLGVREPYGEQDDRWNGAGRIDPDRR